MSLIRPELAARLHLWREVIAAGTVAGFGAWVFSGGGLLLQPLGLAMVACAVMWGVGAWRRIHFARRIAAPGLVEVDEGAIRYLGARALGGEVALRDLTEIRLLRLDGRPYWRLRTANAEALLVPADAAGAEALADAFTALPGFDLGAAVAALNGNTNLTTVWRRR